MGEGDVVHVDDAALRGIARQYGAVADVVDAAVRMHLTGLAFDGASAGRMHASRGDAVHGAVGDVVDQLRRWSRAATEISAGVRASADRYAEVDARVSGRVG